MEELTPRGVIVKRRLHNGAIAGVVVGVCVGVALLAFCLYPVIVCLLKRRKKGGNGAANTFDPEVGEVPPLGGPPGAGVDGDHRRLSSQESFKPAEDVTRGVEGAATNKHLPWTSDAQPGFPYGQEQQQSQTYPAPIDTTASAPYAQQNYEHAPFPDYSGEFMPQGANAEYYSPTVPSEAFGMITEETPVDQTASRASSLRQSMRHLFSRKSTRDQSFDTFSSPALDETPEIAAARAASRSHAAALQHAVVMDRTESPTHMEAPMFAMPPPPLPTGLASPVQLASQPRVQETLQTPPHSPPSEAKYKLSPSPPTHPAPGTVNPMDIMPATTESEMWHRTEHQLYISSQSSPPVPEPSDREDSQDAPSPFSLPPQTMVRPTPVVQSPTPTQQEMSFKEETADNDILMTEIPSHTGTHLSPLPDYNARHNSYPSDQSTPLPGPASTNPSTQNTPATILDTPSPKSEITSSDYRHSASPNPAASNFSPRLSSYPCDEPGCHQVFDQPHKLKHHQRYHTKDHKCPYADCGKGFGTKTHLQRHINDRHEKKKKFHCAVAGCDYSRQGGKGFPRKDNWKRHMTKIHGLNSQQLPEPVEVDQDMGGT